MKKYYKAEPDRLLRITTRLAGVIFLVPPGVVAFAWYKAAFAPAGCRQPPPFLADFLGWMVPVLLAAMGLTAWLTKAMAPRGYELDDIELRIDRAVRPITVPLRDILEVTRLEDGLLRRSARLMGTSGFYGYYGLFWNRKLGRYRAYATRLNGLVGVRTERTLYALSPDDPEDFIATLGALLPRR